MNLFKSILSSFLIFTLLFSSNQVRAEDKPAIAALPVPIAPSTEKNVGAAISPMHKGQTAPFTGLLLSPDAVASIIADYRSMEARIAIEVDKVKAEMIAKRDFDIKEVTIACTTDKKILQADIDTKSARIKTLEDAAANPPSRSLWAGIGFVGGVVFTVATVFVVTQVTK